MYQITVRPLLLSGKDTFRQIIPLLSWMVLSFTLLALMCITNLYLLAIPFFLEFACVVPVAIWTRKRAKKIKEKARKPRTIAVTLQNKKIYKDSIELNLLYVPSQDVFYINNTRKSGKCKFYHSSFSAMIEGRNNALSFANFCLRNNVPFNIITSEK